VKTIVLSTLTEFGGALKVMLTNYISTTSFCDRRIDDRDLSPRRRFTDMAAHVKEKL